MYTNEYIINKCKENGFNASDLDKLSRAFNLIKEDEYLDHNMKVAGIVTDLNASVDTILASLMHDTKIENSKIKEEFGESVLNIIINLNKINKLKLNDYTESSSIYLRKVLVGISEDVRVIVIKLADRLDEMRNADKLSSEDKKNMCNETMNVLIPIAHRLGINSIKSELENLCLLYSKPDVYNEILEKLNGTKADLNQTLEEMKNDIADILTDHGIKFTIKSRVKSVYSIYNKLSTGRKWSDIYDILAMRLIVPTKEDCYLAIGLIHAKYRPIPKRFKDYIAMPKENMYQSLHTSVFGIDGNIFEIQLRTKEMDEIAEHGIASHWSYKEHGTKSIQNMMEQKLEIFRNTIDLSKKEENDDVFAKNMEEELLSSLIYVYTPKGDVVELPDGATPIDFAYRIHSGVGDTTVGAIVNDQIVPLDYSLSDGDIVKINTLKTSTPNKDWLKFVKTTQAKNKIKAFFSKIDRENYIEKGKELLEKEIRKNHLAISDILNEENINKLLKELKLKDEEELYLSIGSLRYTGTYILNIITDDHKDVKDVLIDRVHHNNKKDRENHNNEVIVSGSSDIRVTMAKCCNPVPGDKIIGYITKGEGISVHRSDCINVKTLPDRLIDVEWNTFNKDKTFLTNIIIKTNTGENHLLDIVTVASTKNTQIGSVDEYNTGDTLNYRLTIKVQNKNELSNFIDALSILDFVMEVYR